MRSLSIGTWALSAAVAGLALGAARPQEPRPKKDPLVDQVRHAIDNGVKFLRDQERRRGNWEVDIDAKLLKRGGWTALAMLALLNAGVSPDDPMMKRGLKYLRDLPPDETYVVGLQTMVFVQAGKTGDRDQIQKNVAWLLKALQKAEKPETGMSGWSYRDRGGAIDNSNSQYALLGLHEALAAGAISDATTLANVRESMKVMRDFYVTTQTKERAVGEEEIGGWGYRRDNKPSMTMTTAGLCNLLITGMDMHLGKQVLKPDGSADNCGKYDENEPVARALRWIGRYHPNRYTETNVAALSQAPFYCLYGLERAGRLTGQRYFGGHDWYRVGCEYLVKIQKSDGSWQGSSKVQTLDPYPVVATSFALLFLSKGRTPILISKLAHNTGDGWNNKRADARHLVDFASHELFKNQPMAWQVFDVRGKDADTDAKVRDLAAELLPSPIVWFNGHDFAPRDKEEKVLKEYVENGGFLFAEACCGRAAFDKDFRELMRRMFPDEDVPGKDPQPQLRRLPPDHPVWTASGKFAVSPKDFELWGVQQGCRTVVIYSPKPISGYWEANLYKEGRGREAFRLGANVIAYATGLEPPKPRLTQVDLPPEEKVSTGKPRRGYLEVGQLAHDGDWYPAPHAMRNLMDETRKAGLDVVLTTSWVALSSSMNLASQDKHPPIRDVRDLRFLYLHGRRAFTPRKDVLKDLCFNLKTGGTLFADACCGSPAFDASFRQFMDDLWAEENRKADKKTKLEPIPLDDELFSEKLNGTAIDWVRCRRPSQGGKGVTPDFQTVKPALEGIKYNGRWVVIYSRYDVGCALEKHQATNCLGHDYASAVRLGKAAVLYALKR
jgi:hypothetical protein